jgi:SulP family sulfate permease
MGQVNWPALTASSGNSLALMLVVVIVMLLNTTGVELATDTEADLDSELQYAGINNMLVGLLGGIISFTSLSRTLLNHQAGATSRIAGLVVSALLTLTLFFGTPLLMYLPRPVLGGMLIYLGLTLLHRWLIEAWYKLQAAEYALIWIILFTMGIFGFISGITTGVLIASLIFTIAYSRVGPVKQRLPGSEFGSNRSRTYQQERYLSAHGDQIQIIWLQGYLFFGTAQTVLDQLRDPAMLETSFLVLDFSRVTGVDASALNNFSKLERLIAEKPTSLIYTAIPWEVRLRFEQEGIIRADDDGVNVFADVDHGLEWCEDQLLDSTGLLGSTYVPLATQLEEMFKKVEHVGLFMNYLEPYRAEQGEVIVSPGDAGDTIYFVEHGQVSVLSPVKSGEGKSRRISTLGPGTIFGEMSLYRGVPPMASVVADQPTRLYFLSRDNLQKLEQEHADIAAVFHQFIIRLLANRLSAYTHTVEHLVH